MSGTGQVEAAFAGEERVFRIRLGEIRRIEQKCGTGIGEVARRLARATLAGRLPIVEALATGVEFYADDVRTVLYEALVGGGMASAEATKLVRLELDDRGLRALLENAPVALMVLLGSQETPPGEPQAGESPATPPSPSTSEPTTASAPPSA